MKSSYPRGLRTPLSRRRFLSGTGVVLSLPWMESIPVFGQESNLPTEEGSSYPKRFAALFMANGVNKHHFWAKQSEEGMILGKSLEPLAPYRRKMNVISGLFNKNATGVGIHPGQTGNLLSGAALQKGATLKGGISMDQVLANHLGKQTMQPSLVLGCEQPVTGYHETNFSMAYGSHISWQNESSPVPMEVYPSLAFDSLFENKGNMRHLSILDRIKEQAHDLTRQISGADKAKLDEYLTSVREVEKRIESLRDIKDKANFTLQKRPEALFTMERPENGLPEDIREHMRLMCDILALAFQTDKTRVATLLLCRDISGLFYPFLDARNAHHSASHHDESDEFERITRYYIGQMAHLAKRLDAMPEGDGTVLDHSCLIWISNMWSGSKHDSTKVPLITLGGLDGSLETGRVLDYLNRSDEERKLCSFYLSIMDRMGVSLETFGDSDIRLKGV
ncbi:MAG: DUF1552 domain-containing protein [Limisphaerales bacterium]|nr:hypothetical protein [Pedosphaera sp.]MEC7903817.1 DUF1552 domain-containing protein [Verrucomicrobiota bacterium]HBF01607.1 hypothetical protein [Verrucomicrobiales bacterium]MAN30017.1 hypothetical protein [Pedosphaera sp.]HCB96656.1 hypothetical protein [Verrucomicrobiales bacterium]